MSGEKVEFSCIEIGQTFRAGVNNYTFRKLKPRYSASRGYLIRNAVCLEDGKKARFSDESMVEPIPGIDEVGRLVSII